MQLLLTEQNWMFWWFGSLKSTGWVLLIWTWLLGFAEHAKVKGQLLLRTKCNPCREFGLTPMLTRVRAESSVTLMVSCWWARSSSRSSPALLRNRGLGQLQELSGHPSEDDLKQEVILFWNWPMCLPVSASQFCSFCFRGNVSFIFPLTL